MSEARETSQESLNKDKAAGYPPGSDVQILSPAIESQNLKREYYSGDMHLKNSSGVSTRAALSTPWLNYFALVSRDQLHVAGGVTGTENAKV